MALRGFFYKSPSQLLLRQSGLTGDHCENYIAVHTILDLLHHLNILTL